jgi:endonuclease/exonuclease/phosphatase family metal-dependent hydrolase
MAAVFRVVTYNVHKCRGLDGKVRPERIAAILAELDADVIALQEVVRIPDLGQEADQALYLAERLGNYHLAFGANRDLRGGQYGNALLTRLPIASHRNYDISWRGRERRGVLRADLHLPSGEPLHVFNVHLGTRFFERRHQARRLLSPEILKARLKGHRVVVGDFNEWTRGLATRLLASDLRSVPVKQYVGRSRTYPGVLPVLHLDHMYHDSGLELKRFAVHRTRESLIASDHLPLLAEFLLN